MAALPCLPKIGALPPLPSAVPGLSLFMSPNVIGALIGAGATLIAALINLRIAWRREVLDRQHTAEIRAELQQQVVQIGEAAARFGETRLAERAAIEAEARVLDERLRGAQGVGAAARPRIESGVARAAAASGATRKRSSPARSPAMPRAVSRSTATASGSRVRSRP